MTTILHITASIQGDASVSRQLSRAIVDTLAAKGEARVIERDLSANDLPFIDAERFAAHLTPYADRSADQNELSQIADTLIEELQVADAIVFGVPIYNFSVPATVKAWADLVARAGTTFRYTEQGPEGLLSGKTAYIAVTSGGTPADGDADFMTPWLRFFLGFLGITDVKTVAADALMAGDAEASIATATEKARAIAT